MIFIKIKHKNSEEGVGITSMTLSHWRTHYLPNKKYLNYEFYDVPDIFELHEIDEETGTATHIKCDFKHALMHFIREQPRKYVLKELNPNRLDEYLMLVNRISAKIQSLSPFFKAIKYIIPSTKLDTQRKRHMTIVVLMILTIVAMFIIAYFQGVFPV